MTNVTVVDNRGDYGGGICIRGGVLNLRNSVVWGNTRKDGSSQNNMDVNGGTLDHSYNLVQGATVITGAAVVSVADPQFVGGGDYRLLSGSPAIDRGSSAYYRTGQTPDLSRIVTDLGGSPRVQNCIVDLGAYEYVMHGFLEPVNGIMYVNRNTPNPSGDGSSWENAYPDLADVLETAQDMKCIEQIWVAEGTYYPGYIPDSTDNIGNSLTSRDRAFTMVRDVKIYGGFPQNATTVNNSSLSSRDRHAYPTILSGDIGVAGDRSDNVYHTVVASGYLGEALLDGFIVKGGYSDAGVSGSIVIDGRTFFRGYGAGVYAHGSMTFAGLTVEDNRAQNYGGGIYLNGSAGEGSRFTHVSVSGNSVDAAYSGGGGIGISGGTQTFDNMLIVKNSGYQGGGVYSFGNSASTFTCVTVAENTATDEGGGIRRSGGTVNLRNSIVWGNAGGATTALNNISPDIVHFYNLIEGAAYGNNTKDVISAEDPLFVDASSGDYSLQACSPAINVGVDTMYSAGGSLSGVVSDLSGYRRTKGVGIDLGAYEYQDAPDDIVPDVDGTVYVKTGCISSSADGSSWEKAYPWLADVLLSADGNPSGRINEIRVSEGRHSPRHVRVSASPFHHNNRTFMLVEGVKIYGGFPAGATSAGNSSLSTRDWRTYPTILSGDLNNNGAIDDDDAFHVVLGVGTLSSANTALDGFTVAGACAMQSSSIAVKEHWGIFDNRGGGVVLWQSASPSLTNLTVSGNRATNGAGVYTVGSSPVLTNVLIIDNRSHSSGGGFFGEGSGNPVLTNVTVAGNKSDNGSGAGVYLLSGAVTVRNSIVWGNSSPNDPNVYGSPSFSHSLVENIHPSGTGNLNGALASNNPQFAGSGDCHLQPGSPAVDRGYNGYFDAGKTPDLTGVTTDLDCRRRILNCAVDMGAYETPAITYPVTPAANGILYVDEHSPNPSGDGSSWANACPNLADPLAYAQKSKCISEIRVAEGTYFPRRRADDPLNAAQSPANRDNAFVTVEGVKIYGGFDILDASTQSIAVPAFGATGRQGESVLSGDVDGNDIGDAGNAHHIVIVSGDMGSALLDGFTVSGGYGGDVTDGISSISVSGKDFARNAGAGVYVQGAMTFSNLRVAGNRSYDCGGGMYFDGDSSTLTNVTVEGNAVERGSSGCGIYVHGGKGYVFKNLSVLRNIGAYCSGGGICFNSGASSAMINVVVTENRSANGAGIYAGAGGTHTMTNITVTKNTGSGSAGGDGIFSDNATVNLRNSIVWGNINTHSSNLPPLKCNICGAVNHSRNLVHDGATGGTAVVSGSDPLFDADCRLTLDSPAVNRGYNGYVAGIDADLDGNLRIQGCTVDLGAYESAVPSQFTVVKPGNDGTVYVRKGATGDGSSWTDAYPELAGALAAARYNKCVEQIRVAEGTYYPKYIPDSTSNADAGVALTARDRAFTLVEGVKIYGGFNGSLAGAPTAVPSFGTAGRSGTSTLSGVIVDAAGVVVDSVYHVVLGVGALDATALLDGFTVAGGNADVNSGYLTVDGISGVYRVNGGGIALYSSASPTLTSLVITGNNAYSSGGGIYIDGSPVLTGIAVAGNTAGDVAAGVFNRGNAVMTNIAVTGNMSGNLAAGFCNDGGDPVLTNVTVAGNYAVAAGGGMSINAGSPKIRNSIIWGNNCGANVPCDLTVNAGDPLFVNSLARGVNLSGTDDNLDGTDASGNPKFAVEIPATSSGPEPGGDYRPQYGSVTVDAGCNGLYDGVALPDLSGITTDLDNKPRIKNIVDLGAYEMQVVPVKAVRDSALTLISSPATIDALANDRRGSCVDTPFAVFDTVAGSGLHHGTLNIIFPDSVFVYTPAAGHYGVDSVDYKIECDGSADVGRLYILTLKPLSKEYRACTGGSITAGFYRVDNVHYAWFDADGNTVSNPSDSVIAITGYSGTPKTYYAHPTWLGITFPPYAVTLNPALDAVPEVRDIRVTLCPSPSRSIRLTSHLDSLDCFSAVKWSQPTDGASPDFVNVATGELNTGDFPNHGTFSYRYTRYSECATKSDVGKAYVHIPHGKIPRHPNTVLICVAHNDVVNINSIPGLELGGSWNRNVSLDPDNIVRDNMNIVAAPSQHAGALFFNVKTAYQQATLSGNPAYNGAYRNVSGKKFVFEYTPAASGCAPADVIQIVIVSHE
jgi:hypothetical protein